MSSLPDSIPPARRRARVIETDDELRVNFPPRRIWWVLLLLLVALCGWAFVELVILRKLFSIHEAPGETAFFLIILTIWTSVGGTLLYLFLLGFMKREVVILSEEHLTLRREAPFHAHVLVFETPQIRNLCSSPTDTEAGLTTEGAPNGHIIFEYGQTTYRIGAGVDEAETKQLVAVILQRFPSLGREQS